MDPLAGPDVRLAELFDQTSAALEDPARVAEAVELCQQSLALAQLTGRDDPLSLARAAAEAAAAYLKSGNAEAAVRHAASYARDALEDKKGDLSEGVPVDAEPAAADVY